MPLGGYRGVWQVWLFEVWR